MGECRRTVEQLTPYLDGLLEPSARTAVERHLGDCPPCRRVATEASGGRAVLRERATVLRDAPLPPGLRSRCEALAQQHGATPAWWQRWVPALAIVALILATGLAVLAMETRRSEVLLSYQLTLDHLKCDQLFASAHLPPMEAHEAENLFASRYGWNVKVPPSSAVDGLTLIAARRCLYTSGTIPHMIYRVGDEEMSLFILEGVDRRPANLVTMGHESRIWSSGRTTYVLVHPRAAQGMAAAARYVMQRAR